MRVITHKRDKDGCETIDVVENGKLVQRIIDDGRLIEWFDDLGRRALVYDMKDHYERSYEYKGDTDIVSCIKDSDGRYYRY